MRSPRTMRATWILAATSLGLVSTWVGCFPEPDPSKMKCSTHGCPDGYVCIKSGTTGRCQPAVDGGIATDAPTNTADVPLDKQGVSVDASVEVERADMMADAVVDLGAGATPDTTADAGDHVGAVDAAPDGGADVSIGTTPDTGPTSGDGGVGPGLDTLGAGGVATGTGGSQAGGAPGAGGSQAGGAPGAGGVPSLGGTNGTGGSQTGGASGTGGAAGLGGTNGTGGSQTGGAPGTGGAAQPSTVLVTSTSDAYWQTGTCTEAASGTPNVTVNDTTTNQTWEGFGGAFNELGWSYLTSSVMQTQAVTLLFSATEGANFTWGRIPIGASDYALSRYTDDDGTWTDVVPGASNRESADLTMTSFSIDRDRQKLIPYIQAAQAVKPSLRFWASPWTPPVWMKTGYDTGQSGSMSSWRASYYDGGSMTSDASTLAAYAQYYTKWVQAFEASGINVEMVSPQNEPGYEENYPSCLWDKTTYVAWIKVLGAAMRTLGVKVMLGTLSNVGDNNRSDLDISSAVLADSTAAGLVTVVGVQWGALDKVNSGTTFGALPIWATTHKCGNYPWSPSSGCGDTTDICPRYNNTKAPNDQAYGVESWKYIRNAITKGKVTAYNAWNMVLDKSGLGIDTSRDWKENALLVADSGSVTATAAYYVFRHCSQYVTPGATVVATSGGDAIAFKNPDGSLVVVLYNSGAANSSYIVSIGGKNLQFAMPAAGWATVKYKP